jgi:hypothetical protein
MRYSRPKRTAGYGARSSLEQDHLLEKRVTRRRLQEQAGLFRPAHAAMVNAPVAVVEKPLGPLEKRCRLEERVIFPVGRSQSGPLFNERYQKAGRGQVWVPTHLFKLVYDQASGRAWAHILPDTADALIGRPVSYAEFVKTTGTCSTTFQRAR